VNILEKWIANCIYQDSTKTRLTLKDIRKYQLEKIRETLDYVKENSIFYREKLKGINSYDINDLNDFANKIPFTSSKELSHRPGDFLCVPQNMISRIVTLKTSGTLGNGKRVFFTENDLNRTIDFFHHGMEYLVSKGDKVLILMPGDYYGSIGDLLKKGLERLDCNAIVLGPVENSFKVLDILKYENIDCIVGIPVQIYQLARFKTSREEYREINIKNVLMSADYVPRTIVKVVEKAFNCNAFTHYGMTEMGFGGGVECKCLSGYHLREGDLYFEIIDPISGEVLPWGREGEVVFTTLTREGMPLIRYRTGDRGKFKNTPCKCSILPRMDYVKGRIEEEIRIGDTDINIGKLDESLFTIEKLLEYRVRFKGDNILQIWAKSMDPKTPISSYEIKKALKESTIGNLMDEGKIIIEYLGEMEDMEISTGMLKRRLLSV
jgi:phenylacetate-coenzyme A ligase PaaK-like adenylate-forming protein